MESLPEELDYILICYVKFNPIDTGEADLEVRKKIMKLWKTIWPYEGLHYPLEIVFYK